LGNGLRKYLARILRGFDLKVGKTKPSRFGSRVEELVAGHATLEIVANELLPVL
jgi:transposase